MSDTGYTIELDNFKDIASIDKSDLRNKLGISDKNGYTPLCFAALNSIDARLLYYLIEGNVWDGSTSEPDYKDATYKECDKGQTPLQLACIAMNKDAVDLFVGNSINNLEVLDKNGNPIQDTIDGYPAYKDKNGEPTWRPKDEDGNDNEIYWKIGNLSLSTQTTATVDNKSILAAAALPKGDIFKALVKRKNDNDGPISLSNCLDKAKNNPLHLAVSASCYESVDYILKKEGDSYIHVSDAPNLVNLVNNDGKTPYNIAEENGDTGLITKLKGIVPPPSQAYTNMALLGNYEDYIVANKDNDNSIKDFYIALALDALYGSNIVNSFTDRDNIYSNLKTTVYKTYIVKDEAGDPIEVEFSNGKILLDYIEAALRLYGIYTKTSKVGLYNLLVSKFVVNNTALNIGDDIPLIDHKCYAILNALHIADDAVSKNNVNNKNAIINAVSNGDLSFTDKTDADLFSSRLLGWSWFDNNQ